MFSLKRLAALSHGDGSNGLAVLFPELLTRGKAALTATAMAEVPGSLYRILLQCINVGKP